MLAAIPDGYVKTYTLTGIKYVPRPGVKQEVVPEYFKTDAAGLERLMEGSVEMKPTPASVLAQTKTGLITPEFKLPEIVKDTEAEARALINAAPKIGTQTQNTDMGFLSNLVQKLAPKILPAITIGGDKGDKDLIKEAVNAPIFQPVFEKFGNDIEMGAKIAGGFAAGATAGLFGGAAKTVSTSFLPTSSLSWKDLISKGADFVKGAMSKPAPTTPTAYPGFTSGGAGGGSEVPTWVYVVGGVVVVGVLFGKKLKKFLR